MEIDEKKKQIKLFFRYDKNTGKFLNTGMIPEEMAEKWKYWTATSIPDTVDKQYAYWNGSSWVEDTEQKITDTKEKAFNDLWSNYKEFQRVHVDPEDLTLATTLSLANKPKGTAVRNWVFELWDKYYTVKSKLEKAARIEEITAIDLTCTFDLPPYTIKELNEEAKELQQ